MSARRIAVVTGSRAEYGLLRWILEDLRNDARVELQVVVTGAHLMRDLGHTVDSIVADGFAIAARVDAKQMGDDASDIARAVGHAVVGFADALSMLKPHLLVVLGDRFEILAAAQTAMLMRVPIAHIHGGELSEGAIDDAIRHAITKMAAIHFVAAEEYRRRVLQLGEQPDRVHCVGAPGLDALTRLRLMTRAEVEASIGLSLRKPSFLVTYHPTTLADREGVAEVEEVITALSRFPEATIVVTGVNADAGGRAMARRFADWAAKSSQIALHESLGQLRYLSLMREIDVVVGNSSSGLIEAPALGRPTVDIGDRQVGRLKASSVLSCAAEADAIEKAIREAMQPDMARTIASMPLPYGSGDGASRAIAETLATVDVAALRRKRFVDLEGKRHG